MPLAAAFAALAAERAAVRTEALAGRGGVALARRLTDAWDVALRACFDAALAAHPVPHAALLAVGGYGRATLAPGSDLDLVVLVPDPDAPAVAPFTEALLHPLWDAKAAVGHAVRSPDDFAALARTDVRTTTTVLDARPVAGDEAAARDALARVARAAFDDGTHRFVAMLADEMAARHKRFGGTVYLLEPDVKHSRGGLRDLDIARWALRASRGSRSFDEALRGGALSADEHRALAGAEAFTWRLRMALHARTGRRNDRLSFDEQEEAAPRVVAASEHDDPIEAVGDAVERMMSAWYRHAREASVVVEHVLARCRGAPHASDASREAVTADVVIERGALAFADDGALRRDPALALRVVELAVARELPLAADTRARLAAAARDPAWCEALRADQHAGAAFLRLLTCATPARLRDDDATPVSETEGNAGSVVAELHDLGLVLAMIPEFAHVTGRVQHDIYHVYTVDVHSVAAVDRLHAIARGEREEEFPLPTLLMADTDRVEILCLATLLHDIGKSRGGSHAKVGADMAPAVAARLGLGPDDAALVAWLVLEHLTLYHAATRRDLGDPATLTALVDAMGDPWRLRALYLLTVADLSTTSPTAMTTWKARVLDELYRRVDDALRADPSHGDRAATLRAQCLARCPAGDRPAVERLLARMPPRYLHATSPEAIARHARALDGAAPGARAVHVAPLEGDLSGELLEVLVAAPDRPGLLSLFAALLYGARLDVQSAQIWSSNGDAVDVFVARSTTHDPAGLARRVAGLAASLDALLDGRADPDAMVATSPGLPRPEPAVKAEVFVHDDASARATVIEVFGRDRPGFLYRVTRALHRLGLAIALAKVNTEGRRAADAFYVTDAGEKLSAERVEAVRAALLDAAG